MHPALWISKSGLDGQQTNISVISNNLANVNTNGFKKSRAVFKDLAYQKIVQPGAESSTGNQLPSGLMIGSGVKLVATEKDFSMGSPVKTDNPLDIAIDGKGFLQVIQADGTTGYTRDGKLSVSSSGALVTSGGLAIQPTITIPSNAQGVTIGIDGSVSVSIAGQSALSSVGNIQLADFINPTGLEPIGDNLYVETPSSGAPTVGNPFSSGLGKIQQHSLEASNVNVVEELVGLIQTQRAYEMNAKSVSTIDDMLQFISQVL